MKTKLKFIIPTVIAVIAIIIAALCINFTPQERTDILSLMSTAQKYLIENQYEQAIAEFNKVIELEPMNVDAYIGLAEAYVGMGDTDKAIEVLEKGYELTGDERLKNMIDELNSENSVAEVTTVTSKTETEVTTEESKPTELQISYAYDWYSIFNYDNDGNILNMSLYNKAGEKRLFAEYEYTDNGVERTVYVDNNLYETSVVEFTDIMAGVEKRKKERANTTKEGSHDYWTVYDENGNCIETKWHTYDADGETYYNNGIRYKDHSYSFSSDKPYDLTIYYDKKGYPIKKDYSDENSIDNVYTYEYDEYGYPVIQYLDGNKGIASYTSRR